MKVTATEKRIFKKWTTAFALVAYACIIHYLFLKIFKVTFVGNYNGLLFIYKFNLQKYIFSVFETALAVVFVARRMKRNSLSSMIFTIFDLLYFIPGFVFFAVTDSEWSFVLFYFAFYVLLNFWNSVIKVPKLSHKKVGKPMDIMFILTLLCFAVAVFLSVYLGRYPTPSNIIATLKSPYDIRESSRDVHWVIIAVEQWVSYLGSILIAYYAGRRKWIPTAILFVAEVTLFNLGGNRIFIFFAGCALIFGLIKISNRKIILGMFLLIAFIWLECTLKKYGGFVADVFRRFSIVPNRLSEQYYDFFKQGIPDLLRSSYPRTAELLGTKPPYIDGIAKVIGNTYYGTDMNANTGLVGGGIATWGYISLLITPFAFVLSYKIFERLTYGSRGTSLVSILALVLASLSINGPAMLANIFGLTYMMFLALSLLPLSREKLVPNKYGRARKASLRGNTD